MCVVGGCGQWPWSVAVVMVSGHGQWPWSGGHGPGLWPRPVAVAQSVVLGQ